MKTEMSLSLGKQRLNQIIRRTPLGRLAGIEEILPLMIFLLSDSAAMITGQTILVYDGIFC